MSTPLNEPQRQPCDTSDRTDSGEPEYPSPQGYQRYPGEPGQAVRPPLADPLVPPDLGGWFKRVIEVVRRNFGPLLLIMMGVTVAIVLVELVTFSMIAVIVDGRGPRAAVISAMVLVWLLSLVTLAAGLMFGQGASVFLAIREAAGQPTTIGHALRFASRRALPLLGWGALMGLLFALGWLLLIVPSINLGIVWIGGLVGVVMTIYLGIVWISGLVGVVTVERAGLGRAFALVHRRFWPTAGRVQLFYLIGGIYLLVISALIGTLVDDAVVALILWLVLGLPYPLFGVGVITVTYAELRFHERPDVLTPTLAAELSR